MVNQNFRNFIKITNDIIDILSVFWRVAIGE